MNTSDAKATGFSSAEEDIPLHFSEWLKHRRQELDLTQEQLAQRARWQRKVRPSTGSWATSEVWQRRLPSRD